MVDQGTTSTQDLDALLAGRGFVDLSGTRTIRLNGADATTWLHDLLTADIAGLRPGTARRSLLLTPTGHVRADVHVVRRASDVLLLQDPRQPESIETALRPYILSADVTLEDATADIASFAIPDADAPPAGVDGTRPSSLGPGVDVVVPASETSSARNALRAGGLREQTFAAAMAWRIVRGVPTMGTEFDTRSLPAEAGLDPLIDTTKGCFLGQESVARVRNLGHPPRVLRHVRCSTALSGGAQVRDGDAIVGEVTAATAYEDGWIAFVRVAWSAATARLADIDGHPLDDLQPSG
jgi:folate-binding protein YgfZ